MKNIKTLILAMSTISLTGVVMPAHAATDAEVDALRKEVSELKQLVQQLSNQQKAVTVVNTPTMPPTTIAASSPVPQSKPGWMQMPDGQTQVKLYGNVRVDATYDFKGSNGSISKSL
ncbi:DcaP family trimeric outer membrane transporter [Acinetobacter baumannii]|uniref:DcaP family trimeric outer membrane transporter n=2 Tax=Acinetobacter baumannii TaxID=470 RepID=UPI001D170647|nr:DcaP family trimeric outer membrane transporter [Acinetobacter baumannii]